MYVYFRYLKPLLKLPCKKKYNFPPDFIKTTPIPAAWVFYKFPITANCTSAPCPNQRNPINNIRGNKTNLQGARADTRRKKNTLIRQLQPPTWYINIFPPPPRRQSDAVWRESRGLKSVREEEKFGEMENSSEMLVVDNATRNDTIGLDKFYFYEVS